METYTPLELTPNWQDRLADRYWSRQVSWWELPATALLAVLLVVSVAL
jgi:hypothetical protein